MKWSYSVLWVYPDTEELSDILRSMGQAGWELVTCNRNETNEKPIVLLIFKKPVKSEGSVMIEIVRDKDGKHWQKTSAGLMPCHVGAMAKKYRKKTLTDAVRMPEPFSVETLESTMEGKAGDYLMIGVSGEMYPCDAEIFAKTYEPAQEASVMDTKELTGYLPDKRVAYAQMESDYELVLHFDDGSKLMLMARANRAGDDVWLEAQAEPA